MVLLALVGGGMCALFLGVLAGGDEAVPKPRDGESVAPDSPHAGDPDPVRLSGLDAVRAVARTARELRVQMKDEATASSAARVYMDRVLPEELGERRALLIDILGDDDEDVRWVGLASAFRYGAADARLVKILLVRALDQSELISKTARIAISDIRQAEASGLVLLRQGLDGAEGPLWASLVRALVNVRSMGHADKAQLLEALAEGPLEARRAAAYALTAIGLSPEEDPFEHAEAIQPLITALSDEDSEVRMWAAQALSRMEHEAAPAVDALVRCLGDPAPHVANWAKATLGEIGDAAIPAAERIMTSGDRTRAAGAAYVLRRVGGQEALRVLRAGLRHADPVIRARSMMALNDLTPQLDSIIAHYVEILGTEDLEAVQLALEGLSRLGQEARPAKAAVASLKDHADEVVRAKARSILAAIGD